jgi:hypothetical protein
VYKTYELPRLSSTILVTFVFKTIWVNDDLAEIIFVALLEGLCAELTPSGPE